MKIDSKSFNRRADKVFGLSLHVVGIIGLFTGVLPPMEGVILLLGSYTVFNGESIVEMLSEIRGGTGV